jgi:AcrR family transcriptional regulator
MAGEIGVTEGAIYRHFKSKRDILLFLVEDVENTLLEDIQKNYPSDLASPEVLDRIIMDHMSSIEQRKGVAFQVIAEIISLGDKKLNRKVSGVIDKYICRIEEILTSGVQSGAVRSDIDLKATARLFFGMTQGLVNIWALSQYKINLQEEYKPLRDVFLKAIVKT